MQAQISINLLNVTNQEKHHLKDVECIIGRGWLNCNDKRISHRHGIIKIKSCSAVDLLSTHDNPMFYRKQSDGILSLLQKGKEIELLIGDLFGLTPDAFWFRLEKSDDQTMNTPSNSTNNDAIDTASNETTIQIKAERVSDSESPSSSIANQLIKPEPMDTSESSTDATHSNGLTSEPQGAIETTGTEINVERIKTETSPSQNGNSTDQIAGTSNPNSNAQTQGRECCKYGIRCYRRNPIHRIEEAHPGDRDYRLPDYEEPAHGVPPCPYGQRCYRRNPTHFKQFSHSHPGLDAQGKKQTKRDRPSDDKAENPGTKKRKPKANYYGDYEDEENSMEDEDPYATDEDSDFDEDRSDDPSTDDSDNND